MLIKDLMNKKIIRREKDLKIFKYDCLKKFMKNYCSQIKIKKKFFKYLLFKKIKKISTLNYFFIYYILS